MFSSTQRSFQRLYFIVWTIHIVYMGQSNEASRTTLLFDWSKWIADQNKAGHGMLTLLEFNLLRDVRYEHDLPLLCLLPFLKWQISWREIIYFLKKSLFFDWPHNGEKIFLCLEWLWSHENWRECDLLGFIFGRTATSVIVYRQF